MKGLALLCFLLFSFAARSGQDKHVISVSRSDAGEIIYVVDDKELGINRLSDYFLKNKDGWNKREAQVTVLLKKDMTFEDFFTVKGSLQGIGFSQVEYFVYSIDSGRTVQIQTVGAAKPVVELP